MSERRHRITRPEIPAVAAGLHLCLKLYTNGAMVPFSVAPALRAYYRITHYQPQGGRPDYPDTDKETIIKLLEDNESTYETLKKISAILESAPLTQSTSEPPQFNTSYINPKKPVTTLCEEVQVL